MIDPELRVRLILWLSQSWPIRVISWWLEKGIPEREGFGRFRERARIVDIESLEISKRTTDPNDRRFFIRPDETPADTWWHEEVRLLRMLDNRMRPAIPS